MSNRSSAWRDRILKLFEKEASKPENEPLRVADIVTRIDGISGAVAQYWINNFLKDETIVKTAYGRYKLNVSPVRSIDHIREQAKKLGEARVIDTGRGWMAGEQVIQAQENPTVAHRRLHFRSILERMEKLGFASYDIQLLEQECKHLAKEQTLAATA